jgi:hypothetical protein
VLLKPVETGLLRETVAGVLDVELTDRGTV